MTDRVRAHIVRVGTVEREDDGTFRARGWRFAAPPGTLIPLYQHLPDGRLAFCGWTVDELLSIVEDARALASGRIGVEEIAR